MQHIEKLRKYSVILASQSPRRKEILQRIPGLKFMQIVSPFDEKTLDKSKFGSARDYVTMNSKLKATHLLPTLEHDPPPLIIAADTVVVHKNGNILEKPEDEAENLKFIRELNGSLHSVMTGVTLITPDKMALSFCAETNVSFRNVTDDVLQQYVATGEGLDKAGGYGIQGFGGCLIERIEGCYYNVMGPYAWYL